MRRFTLATPREATHRIASDPDRYPWPAIYEISLDDHWIFRDQKTGSGTGIAFLYHVEQTSALADGAAITTCLPNGSDDRIARSELLGRRADRRLAFTRPVALLSAHASRKGSPMRRELVNHLSSHTITE